MTSARKRGRTKIGGQFAPRIIEMLESPAYRVLSQSEHRVLARLEIELAHHGGADNGRLPTTFDDFELYGVHRHSIGPAIRALVALGFVEITQPGRAGNGEWRRPTIYRLTYRHTANLNPTDDWKKIETIEEAMMLASAARKAAEKQKAGGGKRTITSGEKRTTKGQIPGADSTTTWPSADSTTTLDISGRVTQ